MLNEYEVERNGITFTMLMTDKTAKAKGLKPVETKGAAPRNKSRAPRDKGPSDGVAPASRK